MFHAFTRGREGAGLVEFGKCEQCSRLCNRDGTLLSTFLCNMRDTVLVRVMSPDRWRQIEDLYHAARERGAGVLADADLEVRQQVVLLLAQDSSDNILDRPAADLLGDSTFTQLTPGMELGVPLRSFKTGDIAVRMIRSVNR